MEKEQQPKVSIILATYNAAPYLPLTLESLKKQTWQNFELLACDNLSKDGTVEMLKEAGFEVISKEAGLLEARDIIVKKATGEYLAIIDADEVMAPDLFERSVKLAQEGDYDYIIWEEKTFKPKNWLDWLYYCDRELNHALMNDDPVLGMLAPRFFRTKVIKQTYANIPVQDLKGLLTQDYAILQYELSKISSKQGYLKQAVSQQEVNEIVYFWKHFYRYGKRAAMVEKNPTYVRLYKKIFETKTRFRPFSFKYFWWWVGANILLVLKGVPWYLGYRIEKMKG